MSVYLVCHRILKKSATFLHKKRLFTLANLCGALLSGANLSITSLGRHHKGKGTVKSKINCVWHFLSKSTLHKATRDIYQSFGQTLMSGLNEIVILVDWSGCCSKDTWLLRGSLSYDGRSIPIYNEVYPSKDYNNHKAHINFLNQLERLIPEGKKVTVVTDGGFKSPWFKAIEKKGWKYTGRVRGRTAYRLKDERKWGKLSELFALAIENTALYLGIGDLAKQTSSRLSCHFIVYKGNPKGRTFKKKKNSVYHPPTQKRYKELNKEPWVLVTNMSPDELIDYRGHESNKGKVFAKRVVKLYEKRMQIEQNFRDDKSPRYGFGWRFGKSEEIQIISGLCLIATLATIISILIGTEAEKRQWHYKYQANTVKGYRVLSLVTLAKQVFLHQIKELNAKFIKAARSSLTENYNKLITFETNYSEAA